MGLIVNATSSKKILIKGSEIELPNVYVRVEFGARGNGTTLEISASTYLNKKSFNNDGMTLLTDVPQLNICVELQKEEKQDIASAELYAKTSFEELGYMVEIL
jgi:hypothetical protein